MLISMEGTIHTLISKEIQVQKKVTLMTAAKMGMTIVAPKKSYLSHMAIKIP